MISDQIPVKEIYLISPFRDVLRQTNNIGREFKAPGTRIGAVHTTQDKKTDTVILVLSDGLIGQEAGSRLDLSC